MIYFFVQSLLPNRTGENVRPICYFGSADVNCRVLYVARARNADIKPRGQLRGPVAWASRLQVTGCEYK